MKKSIVLFISKGFLSKLLCFWMLLSSNLCFAAFQCQVSETWNGTATVQTVGNYTAVKTDGFNGTFIISGVDIASFDYPTSLISQDYDTRIQTNGSITTHFWIYYDPATSIVHVYDESGEGMIAATSYEMCVGSTIQLHALDATSYTVEWGEQLQGATDTTWLPDYKGHFRINYTTTSLQPVTVFTRLTSPSNDTIIHSRVITPTYSACGYTVTASKRYVCSGHTATFTTDYTGGSMYVWKDEKGTVLGSSIVPTIELSPTESTNVYCYADGVLVDKVAIHVVKCTFFIASRYPVNSCLQDSNMLYASGTAMLDEIHGENFVWETSDDQITWTVDETQKTFRYPVSTSNHALYYRVTCNGGSAVINYPEIDCSKSIYCNGLETKTLFYETFGFFMSGDVYVVNNEVFSNKITVNHKTSVTVGSSTYSCPETYNYSSLYYTARGASGDVMTVDTLSTSTFPIRNYIAPDPFGYVVPATKFVSASSAQEANQFVGTDGHLFLTENPMLAQYEKDTWVKNASSRLQDGYYAIVLNPDTCDQNKDGDDFISCTDYTGNSNGAMLFVNAGKTQDSKSAIYAQKAPLACPADRFNFGMSIRNATTLGDGNKNPVNLTICLLKEMNVESKTLPSEGDKNVLARLNTGDVAAGSDWYRIDEFIELSEKTDDVWVVIYNNGMPGDGNDMLLDDISFSVCIPKSDLKAVMNGDTLDHDVITCSGGDVKLLASQYSAYLDNPHYLFQYQKVVNGDTTWVDLKDYTANPDLMREDTAIVNTSREDFWGDIPYRVIIADEERIAREIANDNSTALTECEFTFHSATTNIVIKNTYGGEMGERDSVAFCNIANTVVQLTGIRHLTKSDHEWNMSWLAADSTVLFSKDVKGVSRDSLILTVVDGDKFQVSNSEGKNLGTYDFSKMDSVFFKAVDEGGCEFYQVIKLHKKYNLDIQTMEMEFIDCNSVTVSVRRNYSEPPLIFDWSSVPGTSTVVNDTTQTFTPTQIANYSSISGKVKVTPVNVDDKYCFLQDYIEIPYTVHNGNYKVVVNASKDPVCVSKETATLNTEVLTLRANVVIEGGSTEEAEKIDKKISKYDWIVIFSKGDTVRQSTTTNELKFTHDQLLNAAKTQIRSSQLIAYVTASYTEVCETVSQDTTNMGTNVEIREGGFSITLSADPTLCINENRKHNLNVVISPSTALLNISTLDFYIEGQKVTTIGDLKESFEIEVNDKLYPNVFKAGSTIRYKLGVYDATCAAENESDEVTVKYNGYDWNFNQPDSCLAAPDDKYNVIATIDSANAVKHINSYVWKLDGVDIIGDGFSLGYPISQSMTGTFSLTTTDGICPAVTKSFTSNIAINYQVSLSSNEISKVCSTESVDILTTVTPATSRAYIKEYKWIAVDKSGAKTVILNGTAADSVLHLNATNFPSLFVAGNSFEIYLETDDQICDAVTSNNQLHFDVNVPFTIELISDGTKLCNRGQTSELKVRVNPVDAINHIEKFVWKRVGNGKEESTETIDTILSLNALDGWLTPADNVLFSVSASDGICVKEGAELVDAKSIDINEPFEVTLQSDKVYYCSEGDSVFLTGTNSGSDNPYKSYTYSYISAYNGGFFTIPQVTGNPLAAIDDLKSYVGVTPGSSVIYALSVNDGDVCGTQTSQSVAVALQTPFKVHVEATKNVICQNDMIEVKIVSYDPAGAENFVKEYKWNENGTDLSENVNNFFLKKAENFGFFNYFALVSDGICYGTEKFAPLHSDTTTVKVNQPIQVSVEVSSKYFCEDSSSDPLILTAKCATGEPVHYELYNYGGTMIDGVDSNAMEYSWAISPTTAQHVYEVYVYDGVCSIAKDVKGPTSIEVHLPMKFNVTIPAEDYQICLGEKVHFTTTVEQGQPSKYLWYGLAVSSPYHSSALSLQDVPLSAGEYYYEIVAVDDVCPDVKFEVGPVQVYDQPEIDLQLSENSIVLGQKINLTANVTKGAPTQFEWTGNDKSLGTTTENYLESIEPMMKTTYVVYASDGVCPVVAATADLDLNVPTAFTPYVREGLNDYFVKGFTVEIYDRYGMKVFYGDDGWDGRKGSKMADPGVYFCRVILKDGNVYKGTIEVVK